MDRDMAVMLARYCRWADQVMFDALGKLPEGEVYRVRKTLFRTMVGTLNHNYLIDVIWKSHLLGVAHGFGNRREVLHPTLEGLAAAQAEMDGWFIDWAGGQDGGTLGEVVRFTFISGREAQMSRGAIFMHLVTHKNYHRGWVAEMMFDTVDKAPDMDLSVFLGEGHGG